jgi:hypothetical protein
LKTRSVASQSEVRNIYHLSLTIYHSLLFVL